MSEMQVRRTVPATPAAVYRALTLAAEIRKWHVPGPDFEVCIAEMDAREGGAYRIGMQGPGRDEPHTFYGVIREARPRERLVYTCRWEPPDRDVGESVVTIELHALGRGTEVVVAQTGLPDEQSAADHTNGWTGTLESLERHFA